MDTALRLNEKRGMKALTPLLALLAAAAMLCAFAAKPTEQISLTPGKEEHKYKDCGVDFDGSTLKLSGLRATRNGAVL